jgi:hypothetical protein
MPLKKVDEDDDDHSSSGVVSEAEPERDEVREVENMARKDTSRVRMWRFAVTGVLTLTAVAVTVITYRFLIEEQQNNFDTAVSVPSKGVKCTLSTHGGLLVLLNSSCLFSGCSILFDTSV